MFPRPVTGVANFSIHMWEFLVEQLPFFFSMLWAAVRSWRAAGFHWVFLLSSIDPLKLARVWRLLTPLSPIITVEPPHLCMNVFSFLLSPHQRPFWFRKACLCVTVFGMDRHDWQRGKSRGHRRYDDDDDGEETFQVDKNADILKLMNIYYIQSRDNLLLFLAWLIIGELLVQYPEFFLPLIETKPLCVLNLNIYRDI